jgi:hypothetical protein
MIASVLKVIGGTVPDPSLTTSTPIVPLWMTHGSLPDPSLTKLASTVPLWMT